MKAGFQISETGAKLSYRIDFIDFCCDFGANNKYFVSNNDVMKITDLWKKGLPWLIIVAAPLQYIQ